MAVPSTTNIPIPDPSTITGLLIEAVKVDLRREFALSFDAAAAATIALDNRSAMRHEAAATLNRATEEKLLQNVTALKELVDLRAKMSEQAIAKAEEGNALRFESVNGFRDTLTDQARDFVVTATLNAQLSQINQQITSIETQLRTTADATNTRMATIDTQTSSLRAMLLVGGSSITIVLLVAQLVLNYASNPHPGSASLATIPAIGTDTKRVDDLAARMDAWQRAAPPVPPSAK